MRRHPYIIDVLGELVCRPLLFAAQFCEVKLADGVTIKGSVFSLDYRVVAIDSHRGVVVRDRESKNVPVEFFLALYEPEKLNDNPDCESHAVSILLVFADKFLEGLKPKIRELLIYYPRSRRCRKTVIDSND